MGGQLKATDSAMGAGASSRLPTDLAHTVTRQRNKVLLNHFNSPGGKEILLSHSVQSLFSKRDQVSGAVARAGAEQLTRC